MFGGKDDQMKIKRKTKIKQKHTIHDPNLLQNNPVMIPQVGTTGMTTGTSGHTRNRSSSSSSSSSSSNERRHKQQFRTNNIEGTNQMGQGSMGPGLSNQGYSQGYNQGMQGYPNTGITGTGTGHTGTGMGTMPINQKGELPPTKTLAKNEAKLTFVQKIKDKFSHQDEHHKN